MNSPLFLVMIFFTCSIIAAALLALYLLKQRPNSPGGEDGGHWWPEQGQPSPDDSLPDFDLPAEEPGSTLIQDIIGPQQEAPRNKASS